MPQFFIIIFPYQNLKKYSLFFFVVVLILVLLTCMSCVDGERKSAITTTQKTEKLVQIELCSLVNENVYIYYYILINLNKKTSER